MASVQYNIPGIAQCIHNFDTASFMFIPLQYLATISRRRSMPVLAVHEMITRSSAKNRAVITSFPMVTPSLDACNVFPSPATYKANRIGDNAHPCFTPLVNHKGDVS